MKQEEFTDIKCINICEYTPESIESYNFGKIFLLKEPYNFETIEYFEYLYKTNKYDILKLYHYLPIELFENIFSTISHFDVDEWKDYSNGSRINRTERFHTFDSSSEYIDINDENFEYFIKICKEISMLDTSYEKYVKNKPKLLSRKEKDDSFYKIEYKIINYYKF